MNLLKSLKRFQENLRKEKQNKSETLKILNNTKEWQNFANFWREHAGAIHTVSSVKLVDYLSKENIDSKQAAAYKAGLAELPVFLEQCYLDLEKHKKGLEATSNSNV